MKYTKEIPTKPGWYWVRDRWDENERIGKISKINDSLLIDFGGYCYEEIREGSKYAGPIEEPEE